MHAHILRICNILIFCLIHQQYSIDMGTLPFSMYENQALINKFIALLCHWEFTVDVYCMQACMQLMNVRGIEYIYTIC